MEREAAESPTLPRGAWAEIRYAGEHLAGRIVGEDDRRVILFDGQRSQVVAKSAFALERSTPPFKRHGDLARGLQRIVTPADVLRIAGDAADQPAKDATDGARQQGWR